MDNNIRIGQFEPDDGLINLPVGNIPDYFEMIEMGATNPMIYKWFRRQQSSMASGSQEGLQINGADGVVSLLGDGGGITAYDTGSQRPAIGIWEASNTEVDDRAGNTITVVARTSTAPGTYINPTVGSATDRQALFECVTAGTTGATEPTWPASIGENVTDNSMVWQRVDASLQRGGYQGVVIAAALNNNGQEMFYKAISTIDVVDHGDVDGWTDGIDPNA